MSVSGFEQDAVRHAHLANIVQQRPPADMHQVVFSHASGDGELLGSPGYPLGVALGLVIAHIQRGRPAFNGLIISDGQFEVGALQAFE